MGDELIRRLRELDPVPGPERLVDLGEPDWPADPVLRAVLEQASTANRRPAHGLLGRDTASKERPMPTLTPPRNRETAPPEHRPWHRWLLTAAALAVGVLALGGLLATLVSLGPGPVAPAADTPEHDVEPSAEEQAIEAGGAFQPGADRPS